LLKLIKNFLKRSLALKTMDDHNGIQQKEIIQKFKNEMESLIKDFRDVKDSYDVISKKCKTN